MKTIHRFFGIALLAAVLAGCGAPRGEGAQGADFQLKMYRVPAAQSKAIADNLDGILASPDFLTGTKAHTAMRATTPFPGTVLVLAPASVQPSIATAVAELAKAAGKAHPVNEKKPIPPATVPLQVHFWVVQAKPGAGDDAAALQALAPTLKRVRASLGQAHFVLEDAAAALVDASAGQDATKGNGSLVTSRGHMFNFHAAAGGDSTIVLRVDYGNTTADAASRTIPELKTTVAVHPGEYVVMARALPAAGPEHASGSTLLNLLVVRVDRAGAAAH